MYRTTSCVSNVKTLLYCRRPRDCQVGGHMVDRGVSRIPPNVPYDPRPRKRCPVTPPPPLPQASKDDRWMWSGFALIVLAGIGIVYAHDSPEIRDWMTLYAPWMDDFIAILYQENGTYGEYAIQCIFDLKKAIDKLYCEMENKLNPDGKSIADVSHNARISQPDDGQSNNTTR